MNNNKVVLLDRDGVINIDLAGSVRRIEDFRLIPGVLEAVSQLCDMGYLVLVITNQACVGRGQVAKSALAEIHGAMIRQIAKGGGKISDIFCCPHRDEDRCSCRKPLPGLIYKAQHQYGFLPSETWFVGDAVRDVEAALAAGCRPALVRTGHGRKAEKEVSNVAVFDNLLAFCRFLRRC